MKYGAILRVTEKRTETIEHEFELKRAIGAADEDAAQEKLDIFLEGIDITSLGSVGELLDALAQRFKFSDSNSTDIETEFDYELEISEAE